MNSETNKTDFQKLAQRKTVLFFQGFQLRYTALVGGALVVFAAFAVFYMAYVFKTLIPDALLLNIEAEFNQSLIRFFLVGIIYVIVFTVAAVFLSHRLVGPTHRIEEELRKMADSEHSIEPLKVREGDEFEGLVCAINRLLEKTFKHKR